MSRLKHHRAVVTGAGAGIGRAIAQRLAEEGAKVVVNDLHAESAEATVALISKAGGTAIASPGDVSNPQDVDKAYRLCEDTWAHCTLAVNNAGIVHQARLAELDLADWDRMIAVHLRGCFIGCRRAIGPMLEAGEGVIVNIASQLGQIGGHFGPCNCLAYAPHGRSYTSGGEDGYVRIQHFDAEYFEAYEQKVEAARN